MTLLTRWGRLKDGGCPTHGISLVPWGSDPPPEPTQYLACPRPDCLFVVPQDDVRVQDALRPRYRKGPAPGAIIRRSDP